MAAILITGGTGSLGRALVDRCLAGPWTRVVILSSDEFKQAMMHGECMSREALGNDRLRFIIGNVREPRKLLRTFHGVDAVIHCAALKWVGDGVYNTDEIYATNIDGTINVVDAAMEAGVSKVLAITSDKGCHPANAYGLSKRAAENYAVAANAFTFPRGTAVGCVRLGNLLWSRGSVAHRFTEKMRMSKPVRLTDARMTRYGIRLSEASSFILDRLNDLRGGEIFVPKLPSFRVEDVAHAAYNRYVDRRLTTPIEIVGKRMGGEKLHEMLLTPEESPHTVDVGSHLVIEPEIRSWDRSAWEGKPAPEVLTSDANDRWLSPIELRESFREMDHGLKSA